MNGELEQLVCRLRDERHLEPCEYEALATGFDAQLAAFAAELAVAERRRVYGDEVFTRGLIEFTNYCRNDCLYCGIRRSNGTCERYRLDPEVIERCADEGYELGFRTFVLQGGEDPWFTDERLCRIVHGIREAHPDCAITLSVGERSRESYERLFAAGAERYLLRHETADPAHYARMHPEAMSWENRMRCLRDLREIGYAVGVGFMVGSPFQEPAHLAADLAFVEEFKPEMCGIGPFVPHHATPFAGFPRGTVATTCFLLSLIRLIQPNILLPATTALGTIDPRGREKGILAGANVVMPNLSPVGVRHAYELYDDKICTGEEAAECRGCLGARMVGIGYRLVVDRGDPRPDAVAGTSCSKTPPPCHPERSEGFPGPARASGPAGSFGLRPQDDKPQAQDGKPQAHDGGIADRCHPERIEGSPGPADAPIRRDPSGFALRMTSPQGKIPRAPASG